MNALIAIAQAGWVVMREWRGPAEIEHAPVIDAGPSTVAASIAILDILLTNLCEPRDNRLGTAPLSPPRPE